MMTTPLITALAEAGHTVDVAANLSRGHEAAFGAWPTIHRLLDAHRMRGSASGVWDRIIIAHPDAGWSHRLRANPRTTYISGPQRSTGMFDYKKHEVEYHLDIAAALGYHGPPPKMRVSPVQAAPVKGQVAIGVGYLKRPDRQWDAKHWGNENYRLLCQRLVEAGMSPVLVGDQLDWHRDGRHIMLDGVAACCGKGLAAAVKTIASSQLYIGNDTGLMHVAAALQKPCVAFFPASNPAKNYPWGVPHAALVGRPSVDEAWPIIRSML